MKNRFYNVFVALALLPNFFIGFPCWALSTDKYKWSDTPIEVQKKVARALLPGSPLDLADPKSASLTEDLTKWIDYIDSKFRSISKAYDFSVIPKPHILIVKSPILDAMATTAGICYSVNVRFSDSKPLKIAPGAFLSGDKTRLGQQDPRNLSDKGTYLLTDGITPQDCMQRPLAANEIPEFIEFLKNYTDCKVEAYTDGLESGIRLNSCPLSQNSSLDQSETFDGASHLIVNAESNWVTVTTGFLASLENETDLLAVLAHELSHYYSAHLLAPRERYGFFFKEDASRKGPPKPANDPDLEKWPFEMDGLLGLLYGIGDFSFDLNKVQISAPLLPAAISAAQVGQSPQCQFLRLPNFKPLVDQITNGKKFLFENLSSAQKTQLENLQVKVLPCLETIPLSQSIVSSNGEVSLTDIQGMITMQLKKFTFSPMEYETNKNLQEVFLSLSRKFESQIARIRQLLEFEKNVSLGHYSDEQDADEKSLRILDSIGVSPYSAVSMILRLGRVRQQQIGNPFPPVKSAAECLSLFDSKDLTWNSSTDYPYIHLGTISDPHHQYCHRAKDMFDRNRANSYSKETNLEMQPDRWKEIQQKILALNPKPSRFGSGLTQLTQQLGRQKTKDIPVYRMPSILPRY